MKLDRQRAVGIVLAVAAALVAAWCIRWYWPTSLMELAARGSTATAEPTAVSIIRHTEDDLGSSRTWEPRDPETVGELNALFRDIKVRAWQRTDRVPIDPVLYMLIPIVGNQAVYNTVEVANNGYVYCDGIKYLISEEDEAKLVACIEGICTGEGHPAIKAN